MEGKLEKAEGNLQFSDGNPIKPEGISERQYSGRFFRKKAQKARSFEWSELFYVLIVKRLIGI